MFHSSLNVNKYVFHGLINQIISRHFYKWLIIIFNGVDERRVNKVGPDRACAEWLLRNGASVKLVGSTNFLKDYNVLPSEDTKFHLQKVDASDSAIHHVGFQHFCGCQCIDEIKLVRCSYIENDALPLLSLVKESLKYLEVVECKNITDEALLCLKNLTNLKTLKLGNMPYVKDKSNVLSQLNVALPNCQTIYTN